MNRLLLASLLMGSPLFILSAAVEAVPPPAAEKQVYGWQLMTPKERIQHRARLRVAKTPQERARIRKEHHEAMKKRAKARGVVLPDAPR